MASSLLMQSFAHMHTLRHGQEPERGRSRTPKATPIAVVCGEPDLSRHRHRAYVQMPPSTSQRQRQVVHRAPRPPPRPPPKGKSPDRSEPGALEVAIHEAHARGDFRQCLQWVLELQGVYLDWDDPRLDTVTEDDLCFAEPAGMGPEATPEERARAERYWAMRDAEEHEARRVWELTATAAEKEASHRSRMQLEAEQRKRDARAQYFREPRRDTVAALSMQRPQRTNPVPSRSLDFLDVPPTTVTRSPLPRPGYLFPVDEAELSAVRSMWLDQGRKGFTIVEALVRPPTDTSQTRDATEPVATSPGLERSGSSDSVTASDSASTSTSTSTSSSSSVPSALFSSILTGTSSATSISTVTRADSQRSPSKISSPRTTRAVTPEPALRKFITVSSAECPLHIHAASVSLRELLEEEHTRRHTRSMPRDPQRAAPRRARTISEVGWLSRGTKVVEGFVDLVGRLPTAYLPVIDHEASPLRAASCPPSSHFQPPTADPSLETVIYLLPLRPPLYPRIFPPIPALPRSPYRPLVPPSRLTPRMRLVPNPQFLRLKALQNRVLWGLVPVPQAECDILADIARRHADTSPGRIDVDRHGHMFTAKEALLRVAVEGLGRSALRAELAAVDEASALASLWSWWRAHL